MGGWLGDFVSMFYRDENMFMLRCLFIKSRNLYLIWWGDKVIVFIFSYFMNIIVVVGFRRKMKKIYNKILVFIESKIF